MIQYGENMVWVRTVYQIIIRFLIVLLFLPILLWLLLKRIVSILWHPVALVVLTLYFNYLALRAPTSFSFSKSSIDNQFWLLIFLLLLLYGVGAGAHIAKRAVKRAVFVTFSISILLAISLFWNLPYLYQYGVFPMEINVNLVLLAFIFAGTAIVLVYRYIASRGFWREVSLAVSDAIPFTVNWSSVPTIRWIRGHRLIVGLIALQLAVNAFVLYRLVDMESRIGGSLLSLCNTEESMKSMKHSIVRIASDAGEGTGSVIREDGYILTNAHVVADDPAPKIIFSNYTFKTSNVIFRDKEKDIAVVKVDGSGYSPVVFVDPKNIPQRSALYSIGYPKGTAFRGEASVVKYMFTAVRSIKDVPTDMVQLEGVSTGGASGAPVMTSCGEVAGMFTSGTQGISLAISSRPIMDTISFLTLDPSAWPKPPEYPLEPDKSAEEAVKAYYAFIKMRDFKRAYLMLTPERVASVPLDTWVQGYEKTLDVTLMSIQKDPVTPTSMPTPKKGERGSSTLKSERVAVRIRSLDLEGQDIVVRYFEGPWIAVNDGEFWRLSDSNIKLVKEPGWDWFW